MLNVTSQVFTLMLSQDMVCGYYFHLCGSVAGEKYYDQLTTAAWRTAKMALAKPANSIATTLDQKYAALTSSATTFRILWLSDIEIDPKYTVGSAKTCNDHACCHSDKAA